MLTIVSAKYVLVAESRIARMLSAGAIEVTPKRRRERVCRKADRIADSLQDNPRYLGGCLSNDPLSAARIAKSWK